MLIVHELHECLNSRFLRRLLCRILLDHLARVLLDSGNKTVSVWPLTGTFVEGTNDHRLFSGITALKDNHCLVRFQEFPHCCPPA
jgi:hypothetical protein